MLTAGLLLAGAALFGILVWAFTRARSDRARVMESVVGERVTIGIGPSGGKLPLIASIEGVVEAVEYLGTGSWWLYFDPVGYAGWPGGIPLEWIAEHGISLDRVIWLERADGRRICW